MFYQHTYQTIDDLLKSTIISPGTILTFEGICKKLDITNGTSDIHKAKVFPVNIENFLEFIARLDPKTFLTSEIKSRINSGKARLVLNHLHERTHRYSNPYYEDKWNILFKKLTKAGIDRNQITFISGDRFIEQNFRNHNDDFHVIGIDSFELIYKSWVKAHPVAPAAVFSIEKEFDFLFLNAVPREHRCVLRYLLHENKLLDNSINSWVIGSRRPKLPDIQNFINQSDLNIDAKLVYEYSSKEKLLDSSFVNLRSKGTQNIMQPEWIQNTSFSFVVETDYVKNVLLVSEKTYKPIYFRHPFMVYGHPLHLQYLRDCGYVTFPELFDETYDFKSDAEKIKIMIDNIKGFKDRAAGNEKIITEKLNHNYYHFKGQPCAPTTKAKIKQIFDLG